MSDSFKALILNQEGESFTREVKSINKSFLKHGDVTIKVDYSDLNFKDGMILKNGGRLVKEFPHIPGIDFSGTVLIRPHASDPLVPPHDILGPGISVQFPEQDVFSIDVPMGTLVFLEAFMDLEEGNGRPNEGEPMMTSVEGISTDLDVDDLLIVLEVPAHRPPLDGAPDLDER